MLLFSRFYVEQEIIPLEQLLQIKLITNRNENALIKDEWKIILKDNESRILRLVFNNENSYLTNRLWLLRYYILSLKLNYLTDGFIKSA
jgi:hypothetical protein